MRALLLSVCLAMACSGWSAEAEDLFYDSCIQQASMGLTDEAQVVFVAGNGRPGFMGLTCEDLKGIREAINATEMVLYPATLAITMTPARDLIASEIAALGLTMANPAVLGVTVIGAFGVVTVYFVLKKTMEDCEKMEREELRRSILLEIERRYGIQGGKVDLQLKK